MTRTRALVLLVALPLVLPGCSVFIDILRALDRALVGPIALLPAERAVEGEFETTYSSVIERIQVVENREGSPARFEAARLQPYSFNLSTTAPSSPGRAYISPDDAWIAGGAIEFLSDTIEMHVAMWEADRLRPAWRASDNIIHSDMEATCDLDTLYAPEIAATLASFETEFEITLVDPVVTVFDILEVERPLGEWEANPLGWTADGTLEVGIEILPAINFTDANGVGDVGWPLVGVSNGLILTYAASTSRTPLSCARTSSAHVAPPPLLDMTWEEVSGRIGFRVDNAPVQTFLQPNRRFLLPMGELRRSIVGPRNLPRAN